MVFDSKEKLPQIVFSQIWSFQTLFEILFTVQAEALEFQQI